jgi:hypothetical protein
MSKAMAKGARHFNKVYNGFNGENTDSIVRKKYFNFLRDNEA